jgi:ribonuclease P protein component
LYDQVMDARLRHVERLTKQADIDAVYKGGRRHHAKFFRIHVKPNTLGFSRFTVSVPRKVCTAVLRNRWKRMLRESFRLSKEKIGPGLDIVAVPTRPPEELKRPQVEFVLVELVKKHRGKP